MLCPTPCAPQESFKWRDAGGLLLFLSLQVPLLLKMRVGETALEKALLSGDNDLVYLAVLHLRRV